MASNSFVAISILYIKQNQQWREAIEWLSTGKCSNKKGVSYNRILCSNEK